MASLSSFFYGLKEQIEFKQAIKITLAALISLYLCQSLNILIHHPDNVTKGLWCVVAAIVVMQPYVGGTYKAIINRVLGVLIGSVIGVLFVYFLGPNFLSLALAIFVTIIFSSFLQLKEGHRIAALSVAVIIIPSMVHPELNSLEFTFFRFLDTCLGILVAVVVTLTVWPSQAMVKLRLNIAQILNSLDQLYHLTFIVNENEIDKNTKLEQNLILEMKLLLAQTRLILDESKLEKIIGSFPLSIWTEILAILEGLIKDFYAIKNVYKDELHNIFNKELYQQVNFAIEKTEVSFKYLTSRFTSWNGHQQMEDLKYINEELNIQLERFRNTRPTRKYDFAFVERYFVFFYSLKSVLQQLSHLNDLVDLIQKEEGNGS